MSGKSQTVIKQKVMIGGPDKTQLLSNLRKKFSYKEVSKDGDDVGATRLLEWAKTIEESRDGEGKLIPTVVTFWKNPVQSNDPNKPSQLPLPEELSNFVAYMLEEGRIPLDEVRGYSFHVLNPVKKISKLPNEEISFEQCKIFVSDRFIYTHGTKELLSYKIIDISKIKEQAGLGRKTPVIESIEEPVVSGDVTHMDIQGAISTLPTVNNLNNYPRPEKAGWRSGVTIPKDPRKRTIIILDIIATAHKVQNVLRHKVDTFKGILQNDPNSQKAKMIRTFQKNAGMEDMTAEKPKDEDENVPNLVEIPEEQKDTSEIKSVPRKEEINGVLVEDVDDDEELDGF